MDNKGGKNGKTPRYSIVTYLVLLFVVVIALVLLSYAVQRSRQSSDLDDFRSEHFLQLDQLEARIDALEARVEELEAQVQEIVENNGKTGE